MTSRNDPAVGVSIPAMGDVPVHTVEGLQAHAGFARRLARELLADEHAAEDVVQDRATARRLRRGR